MSKELEEATPAQLEALANQAVTDVLLEQTLTELAALPLIDYDRRREETAKTLGIRVSTLDAEVDKRRQRPTSGNGENGLILGDPEPWPSPVDGVELLNRIRDVFTKYVVMPAEFAVTLALWTLHTYVLDAAEACPYLAVYSPEPECGKTLVISILTTMVRKPLAASNVTGAALFRVIERYQPTLLLDEMDTYIVDNNELRGVMNSGHTRATAYVIRNVGDNHEPKRFSTWACKAVACIGALPATLHSRSIALKMRRKAKGEHVQRKRDAILRRETADIPRLAMRWADDNLTALKVVANPEVPDALNDRAADCWMPLFAIADRIGDGWPKLARNAALMLANEMEAVTIGVRLLSDIKFLFESQKTDRFFSESLAAELAKLEGRPWAEWGRTGKPMSKNQLAHQLSRYDVASKTVRIANETNKGYHLDQFKDAFSRYLAVQNVTTSQPTPDVGFSPISKSHKNEDVTFPETSQPSPVLNCDVVTFRNPLYGDIEEI